MSAPTEHFLPLCFPLFHLHVGKNLAFFPYSMFLASKWALSWLLEKGLLFNKRKRCCEGCWRLFSWFNLSRVYLERYFQERTIPTADNITANPITTVKSSKRLFMPVAPINICLIPSTA